MTGERFHKLKITQATFKIITEHINYRLEKKMMPNAVSNGEFKHIFSEPRHQTLRDSLFGQINPNSPDFLLERVLNLAKSVTIQ